MISSPALLHWFLDHQPLTFPVDSALALWYLSSRYMQLAQRGWSSNTAEAGYALQMTTASSAYFQHLAKPTVTSRLRSSLLSHLRGVIASCQANLLIRINRMADLAPRVVWGQALQDLLQAPAVHEVAMLQLAGACHCSYSLWGEQHAKGAAKGTSSRSAKGKGKSSSSSTSKAAGGTAALGIGCCSSFQELSVAPDHEIVAVAGGHAATVAAYAKVSESRAEVEAPHDGPLMSIQGAVQVMGKVAGSGGIQRSSITDLQLLLESVILGGIGEEVTKSPPKTMLLSLNAFMAYLPLAKLADRRAFVAARGALLLQVLGVVLRAMAEGEQQQQETSMMGECIRSTVLIALSLCVSAEENAGLGEHVYFLSG